jgi:peptidoglycan/xylan/chitin deacetylase (PgdA/CDA1 family)
MNHMSIRPRAWQGRRLLALTLALATLASLGLLAAPGIARAETIVSIQFDDGISDQYQALPIFAAHGMHGTFFINSAEVGTSGFYMNWAQIHDIADAGNEIGGHTLHHPDLPTLSAAEATTEICDDRTALVNQGFTVTDFAYPYGHTNSQIEAIVQSCGYNSARGVTGIVSPGGCTSCPFAETIPPADPFLTRTPENAQSTTTLADLQGYVTQAEAHGGGWVQIVIHHLCLGCETYSTPPATLDSLLAWLEPRAATGTLVLTTRAALQRTQSSDTTPPTVALTAPADGATVSGTVAVSATAGDNVAVGRVEFYRGTTLIGSDGTSPYSVNWNASVVPTGSYVLTAKAFDTSGNVTTSASRTVSVSNGTAFATIVAIQFDDGDADQFQVRSMLTNHGMDATFYINSARIGASGYMTLDQLQTLQADGNEIAGHTVTHADLPTLGPDEQARQVCNDRVALLNLGFPVRSFAYPYGDFNSSTETVVSGCGYNNARTIGGLVTPSSCSGCPYSDTIPPHDVFAIPTPDSIKAGTTLAQMQGFVLQAEQHGGGLVPLVMHHVSTSCTDDYCVSPTTLEQFLAWLEPRASSGTTVAKIGDVVGGAVKPGVPGPPPPPPSTGPNLIQNPSLEVDANNDQVADCWQLGGFGTNTFTWARTTDAHTGSFAEQVTMSSFTDGDRRLITRQDLGTCSPSVTPGHTYLVSAWYKTTGNSRIVVYTRNAAGNWVFFAQQAAALPAASAWTSTTFTTPAVPAGTTALSIGMSLRSTGTLAMDDFSIGDTDQAAPSVALTAPTDGQTVSGVVNLTATATDPSGVARVDFLVNGTVVGSSTTAPYTYAWDSTSVSGTASIAARAVDTAGNSATSASALVTSTNTPVDSTPPVSTATCDGGACSGAHAPGTLVALAATDAQSGVDRIVYTTDGTAPTQTNGIVYTQPFALSSTTTVQFRAFDVAGNAENVNTVTVAIDTGDPTVTATCDGAACDNAWKNGPVTVAISAADEGSGIDRIVYTLDGSDPTATHGEVYAAPFSVAATSTVRFRAIDLVGALSAIGAASIRIDTVAPATTASCNGSVCGSGWLAGPVSVAFAATDSGGSGVARTVYTTDGTDPTASSTAATGPVTVSTTTQIRFRSYDEAGNAEAVSAVTVNVDGTAPSSSASCNGSPCSAATTYASPLAVTLAATDAGSGVAELRYTTDGTTPTATTGTVYSGPFSLAADTTLTYRAFDVAGNAEAANTIALHVATTPTDTTPPITTATCTGGPCASWHTGPVTVTLAATDDQPGAVSTRYTTDGTDPTATTGTVYSGPIAIAATTALRFRSFDAAGNAEAVQSVNVAIDATLPTTTATCAGVACTTAWSRTALNVTISAADTGSGVASIRYTTNGTAPTATTGTLYQGPVAVTTPITLMYRAFDVAGNAGAVGTLTLRVDLTLPTVAATCNGATCAAAWYASPLSFALTAADTGSGVASIRYTTNGTDPTATSTAYTGPISVTSTRSYRFRAYDVAGNAGAVTRLDLSIDSTLPVPTARCNGGTCPTGWVRTAQSVALTATDTGSGVARLVYTTNGTTASKTNGLTYTGPINVTTQTTISYIAVDVAGNASTARSLVLRVDLTPPVVTITAPANGSRVSGTVHVTGTAQDNVVLVTLYIDGALRNLGTASTFNFSWNTASATPGPHTIFVRATDQAGNQGQSATVSVTR